MPSAAKEELAGGEEQPVDRGEERREGQRPASERTAPLCSLAPGPMTHRLHTLDERADLVAGSGRRRQQGAPRTRRRPSRSSMTTSS